MLRAGVCSTVLRRQCIDCGLGCRSDWSWSWCWRLRLHWSWDLRGNVCRPTNALLWRSFEVLLTFLHLLPYNFEPFVRVRVALLQVLILHVCNLLLSDDQQIKFLLRRLLDLLSLLRRLLLPCKLLLSFSCPGCLLSSPSSSHVCKSFLTFFLYVSLGSNATHLSMAYRLAVFASGR